VKSLGGERVWLRWMNDDCWFVCSFLFSTPSFDLPRLIRRRCHSLV
jgi:hypothetical protein